MLVKAPSIKFFVKNLCLPNCFYILPYESLICLDQLLRVPTELQWSSWWEIGKYKTLCIISYSSCKCYHPFTFSFRFSPPPLPTRTYTQVNKHFDEVPGWFRLEFLKGGPTENAVTTSCLLIPIMEHVWMNESLSFVLCLKHRQGIRESYVFACFYH